MSRFFRFLPMCLGMDFFECTMFGICPTSWICRFMSFPKFEKFSATIISLIIFSASHFFWDFNDISIMCFFFLFYWSTCLIGSVYLLLFLLMIFSVFQIGQFLLFYHLVLSIYQSLKELVILSFIVFITLLSQCGDV